MADMGSLVVIHVGQLCFSSSSSCSSSLFLDMAPLLRQRADCELSYCLQRDNLSHDFG